MFTPEEMLFMKELGLEYSFGNLTDEQWVKIEDVVATELETKGLDKNYNPNEIGKICESILSKLP